MTTAYRLDFALQANGNTDEYCSSTDIVLDGKSYQARLVYRQYDDSWMGSLYTPGGEAIIEGALCNDGEDWLSNVVHADRPPGQLMVKDTLGSSRDPGALDWRAGVWLIYIPEAA